MSGVSCCGPSNERHWSRWCTRAPYNLPAFEKRLAYPGNRDGVVKHVPDPSVRKRVEVDVALIDQCVQEFASHARLIKCRHESAGKKLGTGDAKMGNVHLQWAFSEAAVLFLNHTGEGKKLLARLEKKHGKGKARSILAHKIGRAVYYMLARRDR